MYRAKSVKENVWIWGDLIYAADGVTPMIVYWYQNTKDRWILDMIPVVSDTVCQFTGVIDVNGTAVYEKDIVEATRDIYRFEMRKDGSSCSEPDYDKVTDGVIVKTGEVRFTNSNGLTIHKPQVVFECESDKVKNYTTKSNKYHQLQPKSYRICVIGNTVDMNNLTSPPIH